MSKSDLDESLSFTPRFDAAGLISTIVQDADDGTVLMFAHMNAEALRVTLESGEAVFWSRSRGELWRKGATSGHVQKLQAVALDCDLAACVCFALVFAGFIA